MRTIQIINMQCKPSYNGLTNVVESIIYHVKDSADIDGTTYEIIGNGIMSLPDPNPAEFTPFETLTEAVVTSWVTANADIDGLVSRLTDQKRAQLNPPVVSMTPPWA